MKNSSEPTKIALEEKRFDDAVVELVKSREHVTYVEIVRLLESATSVKGDLAITLGQYPNIILWFGVSEEFCRMMQRLINSHRIYQHPAELLTYMIDGGLLSLPIAKSKKAFGSKKDYWVPVCFCTFPHETSPSYDPSIHSKHARSQKMRST